MVRNREAFEAKKNQILSTSVKKKKKKKQKKENKNGNIEIMKGKSEKIVKQITEGKNKTNKKNWKNEQHEK